MVRANRTGEREWTHQRFFLVCEGKCEDGIATFHSPETGSVVSWNDCICDAMLRSASGAFQYILAHAHVRTHNHNYA